MKRFFRGFQRNPLVTLLALGGVALLSVCTDINGPERAQRGHVAFAPTIAASAAAALGSSSTVVDNVRIIIRAEDGTIVLDTIVVFPAGEDEISFAADIPVHGDRERFRATIQLRSGDDVLFEGTQDLDVRPGQQSGSASPVPVTYVGTGFNAVSLSLAPGNPTLLANGSLQLTATVRDGSGNAIQDVPLGWTSSDETVATVANDGTVTATSKRGTAVITATTFGGISGTSSAKVVLPPAQLKVISGGGQTGPVGETLPLPFEVQLIAADGIGVAGVAVAFSASGTGASISPTTATTGDDGRASASMKLGTVAGSYGFSASAASFSASVGATAAAGEANRIAVESGNGQSGLTGTTLPQPLTVKVSDEFGNPGVGKTVTWTAVTGGSITSTSTTNASGIATASYTLPVIPGAQVISATLSVGGGVTFGATALPRPPSNIAVVSGGSQSGPAGGNAQPLVVRVTDALDQTVRDAVVTWTVAGGATISGTSSSTNTSGFASIGATFATTPGTSTVTATIVNGAAASFALTTAGPPAIIEIVAGDNQTAPTGGAVPIAPSVRVLDAVRTPLAGISVTFGGTTGGGSVTGAVQVTNANGIATVGSWVLGGLAAPQTLTATAGTLNVTFHATVAALVSSLGAVGGYGQIVAPSQPLQPIVVQATGPTENPVPGATIQFSVISGSATPTSGAAVTDANGHASFTTTSPATPGSTTIRACVMPLCVIFTDITFTTITSGSIWRGTTSTDWFTGSNWSTGLVPTAASDVFIPGNTTNSIALTGATATMNKLFMAQGSFMNIGTSDLDIASNVNTSGGFVFGTGVFRLAALAGQITGSMPSLLITGTVTASGTTDVSGNVTVQTGGRLDIGAGVMFVSGGFNVDPAARLTMNNAGGTLSINGSAFFAGTDMGNTDLTAGLLEVSGNFTASNASTQAFRATGTHTTRLTGFTTQTLNFLSANVGASRFQNLEITNGSVGGITMSSNVFVAGTMQQGGRLTVPLSRAFTVTGLTTLQSGSITTVSGGTLNLTGGCVNQGGTATGFTC